MLYNKNNIAPFPPLQHKSIICKRPIIAYSFSQTLVWGHIFMCMAKFPEQGLEEIITTAINDQASQFFEVEVWHGPILIRYCSEQM